jgi:chemotaxis response regulator CheB
LSIIVSGAGGVAELFDIFNTLPSDFGGTVIVIQTMPEELLSPLIAYMNQICSIPVSPISLETPILAGQCYIGTSDTVVELQENQTEFYLTRPNETPMPGAGRQGVDMLLHSVADRFSGMFSLTLLSGTKACSLQTLHYFKAKLGSIIVKRPSTCMIGDYLEEIKEAGLSDAEAAPGSIVKTIIEHFCL